MKHYLAAVFALFIFALPGPSSALAQTWEKMVIEAYRDQKKHWSRKIDLVIWCYARGPAGFTPQGFRSFKT